MTTIDDIELQHWIQQLLSLELKHLFRDKFNETYFLANIDIFLSDRKKRKVSGEALSEVEAAAKAYSKWVKLSPSGKREEKGRTYLKGNGRVAAPFDKGIGFCVMRKTI